MKMTVSGISEKNNEKFAYVEFEDGKLFAQGTIPDCKITKNQGFSDEEVKMLEDYMIANLAQLKKQAAMINPFRAMMFPNDKG